MSCWELEVEACVLAKKSCWTADSDATGFMFCVHLSKGTLKSRQSILPRGDGAFPTIQLPLLGKNLPCSSMATAFEGDGALHQSTSRDRCHDKKQARASDDTE
jgi:hypothetical protein